MIPLVKTRPVIKGGVGGDRVGNSRGEDGEEMTDASDALANDDRFLLLRRHVIVTTSSLKLITLLPLRSEYLCCIFGCYILVRYSSYWEL